VVLNIEALSARTVLERVRAANNDMRLELFISADWNVLRADEFEILKHTELGQQIREKHEVVQLFNALPKLDKYGFVPGEKYIGFDVAIGVFRRNPDVSTQ
jgi:hypothetical protein